MHNFYNGLILALIICSGICLAFKMSKNFNEKEYGLFVFYLYFVVLNLIVTILWTVKYMLKL